MALLALRAPSSQHQFESLYKKKKDFIPKNFHNEQVVDINPYFSYDMAEVFGLVIQNFYFLDSHHAYLNLKTWLMAKH